MIEKEIIPDKLLNKNSDKFKNSNPRIQRVLSMLLDHIIMCIIIVPLGVLIFGIISQFDEYLNKPIGMILIWSPMFLYFNKDFFKAKSGAKRFLGYQIIDNKTKKPASELQCFLRNLTIIAWPIEVLVGLINPERRIGDFLANTKVIPSEKEKLKSIWSDMKNTKLKTNFIGILIIGGLYFYGLSQLMPVMR
jgi:uncharacterized RDD family membrane protein YckC